MSHFFPGVDLECGPVRWYSPDVLTETWCLGVYPVYKISEVSGRFWCGSGTTLCGQPGYLDSVGPTDVMGAYQKYDDETARELVNDLRRHRAV